MVKKCPEAREDAGRQRGRRAGGRQRDDRNSARDVRLGAGIRRCDIMSVSMTQCVLPARGVCTFWEMTRFRARLHAKTQIGPETDGRCCAEALG